MNPALFKDIPISEKATIPILEEITTLEWKNGNGGLTESYVFEAIKDSIKSPPTKSDSNSVNMAPQRLPGLLEVIQFYSYPTDKDSLEDSIVFWNR